MNASTRMRDLLSLPHLSGEPGSGKIHSSRQSWKYLHPRKARVGAVRRVLARSPKRDRFRARRLLDRRKVDNAKSAKHCSSSTLEGRRLLSRGPVPHRPFAGRVKARRHKSLRINDHAHAHGASPCHASPTPSAGELEAMCARAPSPRPTTEHSIQQRRRSRARDLSNGLYRARRIESMRQMSCDLPSHRMGIVHRLRGRFIKTARFSGQRPADTSRPA